MKKILKIFVLFVLIASAIGSVVDIDNSDSSNPILTFNRASNFTTSAKYPSTYTALTYSKDNHYMVGYVLQ